MRDRKKIPLFIVFFLVLLVSSAAAKDVFKNSYFELEFGTTGITSLKAVNDDFKTNFIREGAALGDVRIRFRMEDAEWQEAAAGRMPDRGIPKEYAYKKERVETYQDRYYLYHGDFNDHYADIEVILRYKLEDDALYWTIHLRNLSGKPVTIGDLSLPLPFNTGRRWDTEEMLNRRVYSHQFISGNASFFYWMRPNSIGPYLVMTPLNKCPSFESADDFRFMKVEYFNEKGIFIHSHAAGIEDRKMEGTWRQPQTQLVLKPASTPGSDAVYGFKFRWADDYEGVRQVLYEEGLFDVQVVPGMTVPNDLEALFALRTKKTIKSIQPEYPGDTQVEYLGEKEKDTHVYRVHFSRLGENMLTVNYGMDEILYLEFFSMEPLEEVIKKRAAHLVQRQQHRDPSKWYNGLFSDWDMRNKILRSPDDTDGLKQYWFSCDDPGLCKAPYIAAKNAHFPVRKEIEAVEYYIEHFLWGKQQQTDLEAYPYGIYGIPNWKVNRESKPGDRNGWTGHLWRLYDYPHIIMLYLNMYRIAKQDPSVTQYLGKDGYLTRAYGTAKAYFTVPLETGNWPAESLGIMAETVIGGVLKALEDEGRLEEASWLQGKWEGKIEHFINDRPNFFYAEYPFGPCAFESTHSFARYAVNNAGKPGSTLNVKMTDAESFMEDQIAANIVLRGWVEPAYYLLGSSRPGSLFYMTHLGGWSIVDYALHFAVLPEKYLRLGYASYLCGWGLMNTGTKESGYGYWYPGKENDGAAGTGFSDMALGERLGKLAPRGVWYYGGEADLGFGGAIRTAATIVVNDPLFGRIAYGGKLKIKDTVVEVIPRDGLRQRFHVILGGNRFHMELERDGFAGGKPVVFDESLRQIQCSLEKRFESGVPGRLFLDGLPEGVYDIFLNGSVIHSFKAEKQKRISADLTIKDQEPVLTIRRKDNPRSDRSEDSVSKEEK